MTPHTAPGPTLLLTNSAAGSATEDRIATVEAVLRDRLDVVRETCDGIAQLRKILVEFDGDRVVVAGGDGSLHTLLNALDDLDRLADTTVGLVPMGTGNDFATGVGLPHDPAAAARVCASGATRAMDLLATDDGTVVVNAAHAGAGAVASERAQPAKPYLGALAYPLAALVTGATTPGYDQRVTVDGTVVHDGPALLTLVANGPSIGGGARLCPGADPADGVLDVLVVGAVPLTDRPALARDLQQGLHVERDDVGRYRGTAVRISGGGEHSRDGEVVSPSGDTTYRIVAGAWTLLHDGGRSTP